jgi:hypothetical protein
MINNLLTELPKVSDWPSAFVIAALIIAGAWIVVTFIKNEH